MDQARVVGIRTVSADMEQPERQGVGSHRHRVSTIVGGDRGVREIAKSRRNLEPPSSAGNRARRAEYSGVMHDRRSELGRGRRDAVGGALTLQVEHADAVGRRRALFDRAIERDVVHSARQLHSSCSTERIHQDARDPSVKLTQALCLPYARRRVLVCFEPSGAGAAGRRDQLGATSPIPARGPVQVSDDDPYILSSIADLQRSRNRLFAEHVAEEQRRRRRERTG